jgi:hypothetical protein
MSGLLFLTSDDFVINRGTKGNILCHSIPGFSLILFYSIQCEHCKTLLPIFRSLLPGSISGCQIGMVNVSQNKACVKMSKNTIAPITYVPYIVLYIDGKPFMSYKGPYDPNEIKRFVIEVSQKIRNNQQLPKEKIKIDPKGNIPQFTIGHPLCGPDDKVCYLVFNDAYQNKNKQQESNTNLSRQQLSEQYISTSGM